MFVLPYGYMSRPVVLPNGNVWCVLGWGGRFVVVTIY